MRSVPIIRKIFIIFILCILSACQDQLDPRYDEFAGIGPDPDSPLIGTSWFWDGGWGEVTLTFDNAETVLFIEGSNQVRHDYVYKKSNRIGKASYLGRFTVTENYNQMNFSPTWRGYSHGANFTKINQQ